MRSYPRDRVGIGAVVVALVLVSLLASAQGRAAAGPVAAYSFEEGSGSAISDRSASGNGGSLVGATWSTAGKYGKALSFDGSGDFVSIPDSASLHLATGMTLEAWVKPTSLGSAWRTVVFKERPGGMTYALYANNGSSRPVGQIYNTAERDSAGTAQLALNTWTHLATTYDGSSLKLFVNAVQVSSVAVSGSIVSSTGLLKIGGNAIWGEDFAGLIDEVRVYNRALTAAELSTDMNTPIGTDSTPPTAPTGLAQTGQTETSVTVSWSAATDNVAVAGYGLYRDLAPAGSTTATNATLGGLKCGTRYQIGVDAYDAAGNRSATTNVSATTAACDTTAPTVQITSPAPGAMVSGTVPVQATAADNSGVAGVQFKLDGSNVGSEDTTAPYSTSWNSSGLTGSHTLTAVARDVSGNSTTSAPVTVTVTNDVTAPSVTITAPANGASVTGTVTITATASDNQAVTGVQFRVDGSDLGAEDTAAPYSVDWSTLGVSNGSHTLTAVARDSSANTATSTPVAVNVSNSLNTADALKRVTVGPGHTHAATRELVRTPGGVVYIFVSDDSSQKRGVGPGLLHAWKANRAGIPTAFTELDAAHRPAGPAGTTQVVGSPDARLDRSGIVHLLYTREADQTVVYQTFSTLTDTWGPVTVIATAAPVPYTSSFHKRDTHNAIILDGNDVPHIVYLKGTSLLYQNRIGGSWSAPVTLDSAATPKHPMLAFDSSGDLHVSWIQDVSNPSIKYRKRASSGTWSATEVVANSDVLNNGTEDQGPSLVVTASGVPYILYINPADFVRVRYRSGSSWLADDPPTGVYTHAPQIYGQGEDIYVFLGHDRDIDYAYLYQQGGAGRPWSSQIKLATGQTFDGSASVRWDPFHETNASVIDTLFFDEDINDSGGFVGELYYMAVLPARPADASPPTAPTGLTVTSRTENTVSLAWTASTDNQGVAGYGLYKNLMPAGSSQATTAAVSGLACGTTYTLGVDAYDAAGNRSPQTSVSTSTTACDTTAPTVQVTNPASGATVTGVVDLRATAADNTGVAGVQFKVDGVAQGPEVATSPYSYSWVSSSVPNGTHTITATARDLSGNTTTSASVSVTVTNTAPSGLVAAYGLNEGSGTAVTDLSGRGNSGTASGTTWSASGKYGKALSFNGTGSVVTIPDAASLDLTTGMTLEAWVNPSALGTVPSSWRTVLYKEQTGGMVYALYANNGSGARPAGQVNIGGEQNVVGSAQLPLNAWTHLAVTYDGASLKLYVSGTQVGSKAQSGSIPVSNSSLKLGGNTVWGEYFAGLIDEVRVYNRALSPAEIATDMGKPL
jgi:chitodextrinase